MCNLPGKFSILISIFLFLFFPVPASFAQVTATGIWQTILPVSGSPTKRHESSYIQAGGKFYLLGGRGIKPVQAYDPVNRSWVNKANTPIELHHFQAVTFNGLIYVVGAFTGSYPHETPVTRLYIYNPVSNTWQNGASIPLARRRGSAGVVVYNNKIYMAGGIKDGHWAGWVTWFDEFDPATNTWKTLPDAPRARDHFQAAIVNDKFYLAGGRRSSASTGQTFSLTVPEVDVYDFITGKWSTLPGSSNIPTLRAGTASAVLGNELIIIGGESAQPSAHKETEALNVQTNVWRRLADLKQPRHGTQVIESNSNLYIVAGSGSQGGSPELASQEFFQMNSSANQLPVVNAGTDKTITLPVSSTTLNGTANDPDGIITGYTWTKFSGPASGAITNATSASTTITALAQGTYLFRLTVTDNNTPAPAAAFDDVKVTVNPAFTGQINSFTLINSTYDVDIQTLANGSTINLANVPGKSLNIRANTNTIVGSVVLNLSGAQPKTATENTAPYALFGDVNGNYNNWPAPVGNYTLTGTPYSGKYGAGTAGTSTTVSFTITDQSATTSAIINTSAQKKLNTPSLAAKVFPNAGDQFFTLTAISRSNEPISLKIFNVEGKLMQSKRNIAINETLHLGGNYSPGLYYAEVLQGNEKITLKILKQ